MKVATYKNKKQKSPAAAWAAGDTARDAAWSAAWDEKKWQTKRLFFYLEEETK
jgi:hypothetical protein